MHPAKEEAINRSEAAAEIGIFAAGFRNHGAQFGKGKCAEDGKNGADDPRGKNDGAAAALAGNFGGLQENSGAIHVPTTMAADAHAPSPRTRSRRFSVM